MSDRIVRKEFGTFLLLLFLVSCGPRLSEQRAIELIRLNYKQQNSTAGAGTWLLDTVIVDEKKKLPGDSCYLVEAHISGLYKLPVMEDTPEGTMEKFHDTLQFKACKWGKIWKAYDWVIIGSTHE